MTVRACIDAIVGAIHLVTEALAFLLGIPLFLLLHLLRFLAVTPGASDRQSAQTAQTASRHESVAYVRTQRGPHIHHTGLVERRPRGSSLHFPIAAQTASATADEEASLHHHHALLGTLEQAALDILGHVARASCRMAGAIEERGGSAGKLVGRLRQQPVEISSSLVARLPPEIARHILLLTATPEATDEDGRRTQKPAIPTKIALLSKSIQRQITSRLYSHVHLGDAATFRLFRMTVAVHNPALGCHLRSLAIASSSFDHEGYLPDQVSEHNSLGVGIEQILLSAPNLQHLYLDLFSLAALHHSTAARLEKGSLPSSLTTEFSLPQYLTLPTFAHLQHVELIVFGLDLNAAEWLRQALPRLQTLTLRWVTRWSHSDRAASSTAITRLASDLSRSPSPEGQNSSADRYPWHQGSRQGDDFAQFIEAVDCLRRWPYERAEESKAGRQLAAISVFAWPRAHRELKARYAQSENVFDVESASNTTSECEGARIQWDASRTSIAADSGFAEAFDLNTLSTALSSSSGCPHTPNEHESPQLKPAPLRLGIDEGHSAGPRRGPLQTWCRAHSSRTWSK